MIKIEKRIMPWCEECEKFEPNTICLGDIVCKSNDKTILIECIHADICSHAVCQYQKTLENTPIKIESNPSPCRDCSSDEAFCTGCDAYYKWEGEQKNERTDLV